MSRIRAVRRGAALASAVTVQIPMRDGILLNTEIDFPPFFPAGKKAPAVLERSPYGEDKEELIALVFAELLGYVGVRQDVRGPGKSVAGFGTGPERVRGGPRKAEHLGA